LAMARKPKKPCAYPMCPNLTRERHCEVHAERAKQERAERHRQYDRYQRDQQTAAFYKSTSWERVRQQALIREHGLCQQCRQATGMTPAAVGQPNEPARPNVEQRVVVSKVVD